MPDLDIVARGLTNPWRSAYHLMKGGHPPEVVAESLVKTLAAELREAGGIPGFEPLLAAYLQAQSEGDGARTLAEMSRDIEQRFGQQRSVKLLARAAQRNLARVEAGRALPASLSLAREHLQSLVQHHFFSKTTGRLIGPRKRFATIQEAREFESRVWASLEPQLTEIAHRLMSNPTASKLRAPRSRRQRRTTAELLDTPVKD
ncbi:MAG TPA: hypothetical protein VGG03_14135 [Thermoanaerobaculia bacterium]|jgi:hypothetical protein